MAPCDVIAWSDSLTLSPRTLLLLIPALLLVACRIYDEDLVSDEAADTDTDTNAFTEADLVGTWVGPCFPTLTNDGSDNELSFVMTERTWDLDYVAHGVADCTAAFRTVNIAGDYELGAASDVADGAREGVSHFGTKTVTSDQQGAVAFVNSACSVDSVVLGEAQDITGDCAGLGA